MNDLFAIVSDVNDTHILEVFFSMEHIVFIADIQLLVVTKIHSWGVIFFLI